MVSFVPLQAQSEDNEAKYHTPKELMDLVDKSKLHFVLGSLKERVALKPYEKLDSTPLMYVKETREGPSFACYPLSKENQKLFDEAENAFVMKKYDEALKIYNELEKKAPDFLCISTFIGDAYYNLKDYAQAKIYFEKTLKENFIDVHAHWFLADTLWHLGEKEKALKAITIAHLLNPGHAEIFKALQNYRKEIGRPWKDWQINPQVTLRKEGDKILVDTNKEWLIYGVTRALWEYEPGYAEKMGSPNTKNMLVNIDEEKESLYAFLAANPETQNDLIEIIKNGYGEPLVAYEIVACKRSDIFMNLSKESILNASVYIDNFH
jgi:tetratricopeptide (TPR) repeat protein